ncbi:MAG: hypothetical protein EBS61_05235 [Betaproteobacteria bacterium]|nr:hypothetical protein [Betaproteobacteria bacterium]
MGDAFVASFSLIGQVLMVRQRLEHWLFWLVANLTGVGLFWVQGLKATAGLYLVFALLALIGLRQWQKQIDLRVLSSQAAYLPDQGQSAAKPISQVRA